MTKLKLTKIVVNCETGEQLEREFTPEECTQYETDQILEAQRKAEAEAKAAAKEAAQTKLAALGLTVEDLTALGL